MNDEIFQAEYRTRMTRSMSDEEMAREMFDAGRKVERKRIANSLQALRNQATGLNRTSSIGLALQRFINELRVEPYTEGE